MGLERRGEIEVGRDEPESMSEEIRRKEVCEYVHLHRTNKRFFGNRYGSLLLVGGELRVLGAIIIVQQTR